MGEKYIKELGKQNQKTMKPTEVTLQTCVRKKGKTVSKAGAVINQFDISALIKGI